MVTLSAAWAPELRTCSTNLAGLPTWISPGANFWTRSVGCCGPSSAFSPGLPVPSPGIAWIGGSALADGPAPRGDGYEPTLAVGAFAKGDACGSRLFEP